MTEGPPKPRLPFLRFSLRAFLLFVLVIGVAFGWTLHKVREQGIIVAELERMECRVGHDYSDRPSTVLEHLRHWFGEKEPRNAYSVDFCFSQAKEPDWTSQVTDTELKLLQGLTQLGLLKFDNTPLTDAQIFHLRGMKTLRHLILNETPVTDAGLVNIEGLTLETLELRGTQITDAGLVHLKGMTKLTYLDLAETHVTDAGLAHLQRLTQLEILLLYRTKVTDAGVRELEKALPSSYVER